MSDKLNANRRQFLKTAGVGAAALAATGIDVAGALAEPPSKWDEETDVLVMGYGGGGAISAINAADAGARVLILEKNPADGHFCNTNVSGGAFVSPTDPDKAFLYAQACFGDTVDDEMCRLWAKQTSTNRDYVKKLADAVGEESDILHEHGAEFPDLPGAEGMATWTLKTGPGAKLFEIMDKNVKARKNIRVVFSSPAKKIVRSHEGEILGLIAEQNGREVAIRGRRATVLASGGYEYNDKLKLNTLFGRPRYFYGSDSNTGDGLVMAMAIGADLWHLNATAQHYGFHYKNFPVGFPAQYVPFWKPNYMIVDQYGKRFFDEGYNGHSAYYYFCLYDPVKGSYPRIPSYVIFDESVRTGGYPLSYNTGVAGGIASAKTAKYKYWWSKDQSAEIEKGWIMKADTIDELAKAINARQGPNPIVDYSSNIKMDPAVLAASVNTFNGYAKQGSDPEFGRKKIGAIENGPFYATEVWPCGPNTQGGPRYDTKGRVLDPFGKPIPRLYKAGELGSIYGERYPEGGSNIGEILAFGRIVGQNAAAEPPSDHP